MAHDNEPMVECSMAGDGQGADLGRRKAVKKIVFGATAITAFSAFPTKWSKPLIEQIVLPAHAQTSGPSADTPQDLDPDPPEPEPWVSVLATNNMSATSVTVTITPQSSSPNVYLIPPGSINADCGIYFPEASIDVSSPTLMDIYINSSLAFSSSYGFSDVLNSGSIDLIFEDVA